MPNVGFTYFNPFMVGATCRFAVYPQTSMPLWNKGSLRGPTIVVFLWVPAGLDLTKLRCVLQLITVPDENMPNEDPRLTQPLPNHTIVGLPAFLESPAKDKLPPGWTRLVVVWPRYALGQYDPVDHLGVKLGQEHLIRVIFSYDTMGTIFAQNGRRFKIDNGDTSGDVKIDGSGMSESSYFIKVLIASVHPVCQRQDEPVSSPLSVSFFFFLFLSLSV